MNLERQMEGLRQERDELANALASVKAQLAAVEVALEDAREQLRRHTNEVQPAR